MSENPLSSENVNSIMVRAKAILLKPADEWPVIAAETRSNADLLVKYIVPLAAIGPLASLIGGQVFGYGAFGFHYRPGLVAAISTAVVGFVMAIVGAYVLAFVAGALAPKFGGQSTGNSAFRLVAYSLTAGWLAGIFGLVPALGILGILGLYSFYLFYLGTGPMMNVPKDKQVGYTVVTILCMIVLYIVIGAVTTAVTGLFAPNPLDLAADEALSGTLTFGTD